MSTEKSGKITIDRFGKDHWSVFAYLETCAVDRNGVVGRDQMRCDSSRHPGLVGRYAATGLGNEKKYPTRLKDGEIQDHDDWDCFDDLEAAGLVTWEGTGANPVVGMTEAGIEMAGKLRGHKSKGGSFAMFDYKSEPSK